MGRQVSKVELAEILGVSERSLSSWQMEPGFPFEPGELRGQENIYDTARVIQWWLQRELGKASSAELERQRLTSAQADLKQLELARARGRVVDAAGAAAAARRCARETRDRLLDVPARVALPRASERNPAAVQQVLEKEIRGALTALVERFDAEASAADVNATEDIDAT